VEQNVPAEKLGEVERLPEAADAPVLLGFTETVERVPLGWVHPDLAAVLKAIRIAAPE